MLFRHLKYVFLYQKCCTGTYSHTVLLPKTSFEVRIKGNARKELDDQHATEADQLYQRQLNDPDRQHLPKFTLLDGPPYANGPAHIGHAVNRLLKDFSLRYKMLTGHRVVMQPGWDCHGLPIELLALKKNSQNLSPNEIRSIACTFARSSMNKQKETFRRWNLLGDWNRPYATFDKEYEAKQLELFWQLFNKQLVYRAKKPVYWSPSSRTALAESELEYNSAHESTAVYYRFVIPNFPFDKIACGVDLRNAKLFALIWTTTPWTLPLNNAISYASNKEYVLTTDNLSNSQNPNVIYLVAADCLASIQTALAKELKVIASFPSECFEGLTYVHPINATNCRFYRSAHVAMDKGTGLVHTAFAHGFDDYQVAQSIGASVDCFVDEDGRFTNGLCAQLEGKNVLNDGNETCLDLLHDHIVMKHKYTHSYPYDWRTKQPVIIRASAQWFIDVSKLRKSALEILEKDVHVISDKIKGLSSIIENSPDWCISRQRVWGVPLPIFYRKDTNEPIWTETMAKHVIELVRQHGSDCWWKMTDEQLLPNDIRQSSNLSSDIHLEKSTDIMDVWFDSGCAWFCTMKEEDLPVDLVLEGDDQFRGWFRSLLLTRVAVENSKPPYKNIVVHGFVVDKDGKKMSKSIGNVVKPEEVITASFKGVPLGVDGLRLWSALYGSNQTKIRVGKEILDQISANLRGVRLVLRFVLGSLCDFDREKMVNYENLKYLDKLILLQFGQDLDVIKNSYENYDFGKVAFEAMRFINGPFSNYCTAVRDRLYCDQSTSIARKAAQTTLFIIGNSITSILSPILPNMVAEYYKHHPICSKEDSTFLWPAITSEWTGDQIRTLFEIVHPIRTEVLSSMGSDPSLKHVHISAEPIFFEKLSLLQPDEVTSFHSDLVEILRTTAVTLKEVTNIKDFKIEVFDSEFAYCERCRKRNRILDDGTDLCDRCSAVVSPLSIKSSNYCQMLKNISIFI